MSSSKLDALMRKHASASKKSAPKQKSFHPRVSFVTKDGTEVSFSPKAKRRRADSELTPFQRHMRQALTGTPKSQIPAAFKQAVKNWKGSTKKK